MKKTLLLVFCAAILLCASSAKAQTLDVSSSSFQTDGNSLVHPMLGGEWTVTILVTDIYSRPIQGALVSAPCTGLASQYTDAHGNAIFAGIGSCPCAVASVHVTTTSCDKTVKIATCGTTMVTCP